MGILEGIFYMLWRGIAIGIIISAPMGPVGILCVQRTLERGRKTGFFTGVGASLSDLIYCLLTGFGLSFIEDFLKSNQDAIQIIGSAVLIGFGVYLFRSNPTRRLRKPEESKASVKKNVLSGFLFTFSNPLIIFLIIGLFARFNFLGPEITAYQYLVGYLSIILGALIWWWVVTFFVDKVRAHFNLRSMWLINKIIGVVIMIFAVVGIFTAIRGIAGAATEEPVYLNSVRGFGSASEAGAPYCLENLTSDTLAVGVAVTGPTDYMLRVRSVNNRAGHKYSYRGTDGKEKNISNPVWGFYVVGGDERGYLEFHTNVNKTETLKTAAVLPILQGRNLENPEVGEPEMDSGTDWNAFHIRIDEKHVDVEGGNRDYNRVAQFSMAEKVDSVGIFLYPGGKVEVDYVSITPEAGLHSFHGAEIRDVGMWRLFDSKIDDALVDKGGDYHLQIKEYPDGYILRYAGGAEADSRYWYPGDIKATLRRNGRGGDYDVKWRDSEGKILPETGKAQFEKEGSLRITFPQYGASMIFIKE